VKTVRLGSTIKIYLKGRLDDGDVFDSTDGGDPIVLRIGTGVLIPKFEENLIGLAEGAKTTFTLAAADAYGPRDESIEKRLPRSGLPPDYDPVVGDILAAEYAGVSTRRPIRVKEITGVDIVVDLNHPLAGKNLTFEVEVVEILPPKASEEDI